MKRAGKTRLFTALAAASAFGVIAEAEVGRDHINVVGSSTVYPFATAVPENFARRTAFKAPKIPAAFSGMPSFLMRGKTAALTGARRG